MANGFLHVRLYDTLTDTAGFARMYQTLADQPRIVLEIFRDRARALVWLGS